MIIRPVPQGTRISQLWGANPTYYQRAFGIPYHNGVDYAAPLHTPIHAIADGHVAYSDLDLYGYGRYIRLYHPAIRLFSFYAHLDRYKPRESDTITQGDIIGYMGSTGNSTGPHLHFEIRLAIDARKYDISPYANIARGRINPLAFYEMQERTQCLTNLSSQPLPSSLS